MSSPQPVVVGTDGSSHADQAVRWAAQFAAVHDTTLHIVTTTRTPAAYGVGGPLPQEVFDALERAGQDIVDAAAGIAAEAAPGVAVESTVIAGSAVPVLLALADTASTIVVGARGRGAVASTVLGSVSSAIVHHAACPVVVVNPAVDDETDTADGPVVVGVDDSEHSAAAVEAAVQEADRRGARLVAVHAWSDVPVAAYPVIDMRTRYDKDRIARTVLSEQLAGYRSEYPDLVVEQVVVMDQPVAALVDRSDGAQLVIVGSRGRGGFTGMLLGSTSNKVLRSARCPVMVVRN